MIILYIINQPKNESKSIAGNLAPIASNFGAGAQAKQ